MQAIEALLDRHGMRAIAYWPAHADWRHSAEFALALGKARLVLINGEGTIHHNRPAGRRLLEIGAEAKARGIPAALINAGWEANDFSLAAKLDDFALVAARDSISASGMGIGRRNVRIVPDLSLCAPVLGAEPARSGSIGFTDNVDRLKAVLLDRCRKACSGATVAIVYGNRGPAGYLRFLRQGLGLRQDFRLPGQAMAILRLRHRLWHYGTSDTLAFLDDLAGLDLLVSGRFHACTLALATNTPFVAQSSNTGKIANLIADVGLASWRLNMPLEPDAIRDAAARGWSQEETEARSNYLATARDLANSLFRDLRQLLA